MCMAPRTGSDVHTMQTTSKDRDPLQDLRYLSIYSQAESVQFVGQNKGNMLMDWTINIATPLSVHNRLPLKMSVSVHQEGISTQIEASPGSFAILHGIHPGTLWLSKFAFIRIYCARSLSS